MDHALGQGEALHTFSTSFEMDFVQMNHPWIFHSHTQPPHTYTHPTDNTSVCFHFLKTHVRKKNTDFRNVESSPGEGINSHLSERATVVLRVPGHGQQALALSAQCEWTLSLRLRVGLPGCSGVKLFNLCL